MQLALISHKVENGIILQRASDGYVNATAMCNATDKNFADYYRNKGSQEFLTELSTVMGIPITDLVISIRGGGPEAQGTWVHPNIAINLGQWCSPKFAVAVSQWVRDWMSGKYRTPGLPPHIQRYLANRNDIPVTHFSMLNEMTFALIAPLEIAGYSVPDDMIPDISMGLMFCKWLRDHKVIDTDSLPTYKHKYADGRVVKAKVYPNRVLADFRAYLHGTWIPLKAQEYFAKRDPQALEYLLKILPPSPEQLQ